MGKLSRRQHLVSKFYLRGFADGADRLTCTPLSGESSFSVGIEDASVRRNFYTVVEADGEESDWVEQSFSVFEGAASQGLRKLLAANPGRLVGEERGAFSMWIALQYLRSHGLRDQIAQHRAMMIRLVVGVSGKQALREHIEQHEGTQVAEERLQAEWDDLTKPEGPTLVPSVEEHVLAIAEHAGGLASIIQYSPWALVRFTRKTLFTSDHPVSLIRDPHAPPWMGAGILNAWGYGLPLSRTVGLIIVLQPTEGNVRDIRALGSTSMARLLNRATLGEARRFLFHHPDDDPRVLFPQLPKPRSQEVRPFGDDFIRPEGLFPEGTEIPAMPDWADDDSESMSLADLTWPIPGRVFNWTAVDVPA